MTAPKTRERKATYSFSLKREVFAELKEKAGELDVSNSWLVQKAIEAYLAKYKNVCFFENAETIAIYGKRGADIVMEQQAPQS